MDRATISFGHVMMRGNWSGFSFWPLTMASMMDCAERRWSISNGLQKLHPFIALHTHRVVRSQIDEDMGYASFPQCLEESE
jgi:hypothetical protein